GDSFALFRRGYNENMPYTLRIQAIEGNRVSNPMGQDYYGITGPLSVEMLAPNGVNKIVNGVEVDKDGAVEAYWISNKVPYDPVEINRATNWTRIEAFGQLVGKPNVLHICHDERPEQYRGVPYLAPVLTALKQVSRYADAELVAAIMRSFFTLFFTSTGNSSVAGDISGVLGASTYEGEGADPQEPVVDASEYHLGPGTINALPKNIDVKSVGVDGGQATFDSFVTQFVKQISASLNIPYEVLMKSFTSSYSASRAALLQAWEQFKLRRAWFTRDFCQPVYEMWLVEAVATGRLEAPGFFSDPAIRFAYSNAEWYGPSMSILDPIKDVNGAALRIQYGLSTPEREAAEMTGSDFYENLEAIRIAKSKVKDSGVVLGIPTVLSTDMEEPTEKGGDEDDEE
ncbi:MAG: phage portal protein, partial [Anaerovibrio sp.]|nr:phage portal protein [Anaerovibrio sp.]